MGLSILSDPQWGKPRLTQATVGDWIKRNCERTNILLNAQLGRHTAMALEAWLIYHLKPRYEGASLSHLFRSALEESVQRRGWRGHWIWTAGASS